MMAMLFLLFPGFEKRVGICMVSVDELIGLIYGKW